MAISAVGCFYTDLADVWVLRDFETLLAAGIVRTTGTLQEDEAGFFAAWRHDPRILALLFM